MTTLELSIPDTLIAWAKEHGRAWRRPWGHELERLIAREDLSGDEVTTLFSRLEAVVTAAIHAERFDLLLDLDLFSAAYLGLSLTWTDGERRFSTGKAPAWTYRETFALAGTAEGRDDALFAEECRGLVSGVFPRARFRGIVRERRACAACGGSDTSVMVEMDYGKNYCSACYEDLTKPWPKIPGVNVPRVKKPKKVVAGE